jgi:hypothetical protein
VAGVPLRDLADLPESRQTVSDLLYGSWYSALQDDTATALLPLGRTDLVPALRTCLAASTRWQSGWVVLQSAPDGRCVAGRQGQIRELRPGDYASRSRPGVSPVPGDAIIVTERIDWVDPPTRSWYGQSTLGDPQPPLIRCYWNVGPECVGFVLAVMTSALDAAGLSYCVKCPLRPSDYARADPLVLYAERRQWPSVLPVVRSVVAETGRHLRRDSPALTRVLRAGLGVAEDPGHGVSFGQSRCNALAPLVLAILRDAREREPEALEWLIEGLRSAGIAPERPWLNDGSGPELEW